MGREQKRVDRWDFDRAYKKAQQRLGAASAEPEPTSSHPVEIARGMAERAAPALVRLAQALTLGTEPEELDRLRGGVRIMAELTVRQLAMVGLKSGEVVEHDVSERFTAFLTNWFDRPKEAVVIDHDPSEESRRLTP